MSFREIIIRCQDPGYPRRLHELSSPPPWLHVRGRIEDTARVVAIVGSRAARADEVAAARELAAALAERGVLVVSGGALGVDAAAHRGALDRSPQGRARTAVVLGTGLSRLYPARNRPLFDEICARGGAVLSQFPADAPPRPGHFVRRNATIAGLADAVVVIGAGADSGALHTARAARTLGRVVGARPGRAGCEALIARGAAVVHGIDDLERALAGRPARPEVGLPAATSPTGKVLAYLHVHQASDVDDIARGTGLMVREIHRALTSLELDGLALPMPGRSYVRSTLAQELLVR